MNHKKIFDNVYLSLIEEDVGYEKVISTCVQDGFDALQGSKFLMYILEQQTDLILPQDKLYIIGLTRKENLEKELFPCGTVLYRFPILYTILTNESPEKYFLGSSCFSESGLVDNFQNTYILTVR